MATKNISEYEIRTLSYYQKEGGIFNRLITVLTKAREDKSVLGYTPSTPPARLLNYASYIVDSLLTRKRNVDDFLDRTWHDFNNEKTFRDPTILFSIVFVMLDKGTMGMYRNQIKTHIGGRSIFHKFVKSFEQFGDDVDTMPVLEADVEILRKENKKLKSVIKDKEEIISSKDSMLAEQCGRIDSLQKAIHFGAQANESLHQEKEEKTELERTLNLDYILEHIESRRKYENCSQIFDMLKGKLMRMATDEEAAKIDNMEQKMLDASVPQIHNHNDIHDSNVMTGSVNNPIFQLPIGFTIDDVYKACEYYMKYKNNGQEQ